MKFITLTATAMLLGLAAQQAGAALAYDQNVTNAVIYGSGNGNGGWTTDRQNNIELGLRAHVRFPTPQDVFNSNGDGTYNHAAGGGTPATRAMWNFDWSINVDLSGTSGRKLDGLTYVLGIDYNPGVGSTFDTMNPVVLLPDNSYGNNATVMGGGIEPGAQTNAQLMASFNLVQNSGNLDFFNEAFGRAFDPTANGRYSFFLAAFDGQDLLARTDIEVIVGTGAVPEPATLALLGIALAAASRRRKPAA